jgi:hypothetical protein
LNTNAESGSRTISDRYSRVKPSDSENPGKTRCVLRGAVAEITAILMRVLGELRTKGGLFLGFVINRTNF